MTTEAAATQGGTAGAVVKSDKKVDRELVGALSMLGGLVPTTLNETMEFVKILADSELIPVHLKKKPSDIFVIIAKGMELGIKPMHALAELFVVNGKPGCSAALKRALCMRSPLCDYFQLIESTDKKCTYETKRKGNREPSRLTLTWEDAVRAGLAISDTYKKYPQAMLRAWTSRGLADAEFPDVVQGLRNDDDREVEIVGEVVDVRPNRALQSVAAPGAHTVEPMSDAFDAVARANDAHEPPQEPSPEDQLHVMIDESENREQLTSLNKSIGEVKNLDLRTVLKQHWTRRWSELDPKKAAPAK